MDESNSTGCTLYPYWNEYLLNKLVKIIHNLAEFKYIGSWLHTICEDALRGNKPALVNKKLPLGALKQTNKETKVGIPNTVKISWFSQLEWGYVWGHIFCRFERGNEKDTQLFEDFWIPNYFSKYKQFKPPNHDIGWYTSNSCWIKIHSVSSLKPKLRTKSWE